MKTNRDVLTIRLKERDGRKMLFLSTPTSFASVDLAVLLKNDPYSLGKIADNLLKRAERYVIKGLNERYQERYPPTTPQSRHTLIRRMRLMVVQLMVAQNIPLNFYEAKHAH